MTHRRLLLSIAIVYPTIGGAILYAARPVEASSHLVSSMTAETENLALMHALIGQTKPQPPTPDLPDGKGKELAQKQCGTCHATNVWTNQHHTRDEWSSVIDNMISKGMHASDDDLDTITDYLAEHFGPVIATPPPPPPSPAPSMTPHSR